MIVVGARCAGAPLARLLAGKGFSVLLLDRGRVPSDTLSTHWIRWPGVRRLDRWGLLDRLRRTGCPPIRHVSLDFENRVLAGVPRAADEVAETYAPRRDVLDAMLVDAAVAAGAELRQGFTVRDLVREDGVVRGVRGTTGDGRESVFRARLVVGADGRGSTVARLAGAAVVDDRGVLARSAYAYWRNGADTDLRVYFRGRRGISLWPTNDDLTVVSLVFPREDRTGAGRESAVRHYEDALHAVPEVATALGGAVRVGAVRSAAVPNARRRAHGPGWVLAGDAGHHKDPVSAQGISDAFADADVLAEAVEAVLRGGAPEEEAMAEYASRRDRERLAAFDYTCDQARLRPFDSDFSRELARVKSEPRGVEGFVSNFVGGALDNGADQDAGWLGGPH